MAMDEGIGERKEIKPQDGPQTFALQCETDELLYGGGVFGGKTWWLQCDALGLQFINTSLGKRAIDIPQYRAVLFRRKTTEFGKLIEETQKPEHYKSFGGKFLYGRKGDPGPSWTFPSGARIFICHLESEDNKFDHDSMEYQFIGFDQLEQFTITQYLHLLSRGRSMVSGLFVRYRSTANPIGPGLKWVRNRFVKGCEPMQIRYMKSSDDPLVNPAGSDVTQRVLDGKVSKEEWLDIVSRVYVPAKYTDNKIGLERDPGYAGRVKMMGKKYEQALLDNNWEAFSGEFFSTFNPMPYEIDGKVTGGMVMKPFKIPERWRLVGSLDPGWASPFSFGLKAIDFLGKQYRVGTFYQPDTGMKRNVKDVMAWMKANPWTGGRLPDLVVSGHDAWAEHTRLEIKGEELTYADLFELEGISLQRAVTDRVVGWGAWNNLMDQGKWYVFDGLNEPLVDEMLAAEHDEINVNDIKGRGNDPEVSDHALDDERYNVMASYKANDWQKKEDTRPRDYQGRKTTAKDWKPGEG